MFDAIKNWIEERKIDREIRSDYLIDRCKISYSDEKIDKICDNMGSSDATRGIFKGIAAFFSDD